MAPGIITIAMTKNAPTVCKAATVEALKIVKKIIFWVTGFKPMDLAWFSSKKTTNKFLQLMAKTKRVIAQMIISWIES